MVKTAMSDPASKPKEVAPQLGIRTATLYAYVNGDGSLKAIGQRVLDAETNMAQAAS